MREIQIRNCANCKAIVDDEDFDRIILYKWYVQRGTVFRAYRGDNKTIHVSLAAEIMNKPKQRFDHIDRNGMNNQKSNLRECNRSQNMMNTTKRKGTSSKYKGVNFVKRGRKWRTKVMCNGKFIHGGYFKTEVEAGSAYNKIVIEQFKEFAVLNRNENGDVL